MKRQTWLSVIVLLSMILIPLASPLAAQDTVTPADPGRVPRSAEQAGVAAAPEWGGTWQFGPETVFQLTRFDGGYYPGDGMVYFMGGRLAAGGTDGSVWSFDPVAGTYADMGVDLVTPISNYTMNLLQDGAGDWGFYVLGGRPADGSVNHTVQVYYPESNTAVQLDPADSFPGDVAVSCTSGLNAVYENKAYVAGGFTGTANHGETWVFDPMAAVGSKWTQVPSATLGEDRAYIMSAVVDGKIYAVGGNWFDGSALINVATVEVMDPSDPSPTWMGVADMPEVCSSSRAYGFDSGSPYLDPDGTPMGGKIVSGCGVWSDENEHVYAYDSGADAWEDFPWLNVDRRDHAGEFLPAGGGDGMPGMWVWGGRKDSDANVLISSEYYAFASLVNLLPPYQEDSGGAGEVLDYSLGLVNLTGQEDTFDIDLGGNLWDADAPATVGPVGNGETVPFTVSVTIPLEVLFPAEDMVVITATSQYDADIYGTARIRTYTIATIDGHIYDANTGEPLAGFVTVYDADDRSVWYEAFADENGYYHITDPTLVQGEYDIYGTMIGWFRVDDTVVLAGDQFNTVDFYLPAPIMSVVPGELDVTVPPSETRQVGLWLNNAGTGDLLYRIDEIGPESGFMPLGVEPSRSAGVDPQVYADLAASPDGMTTFLVYLTEQADLSAAFQIDDWSERGHYVLDALRSTAERTQAGLRSQLDRAGFAYESRYIVNALVVEANLAAVESIATMPEVAYIAPNSAIPAPEPVEMDPGVDGTDAVEWNIAKVGADEVWSAFGVTGTGIIVSNIDTGVLYNHLALVNQYRGNLGGGAFDHAYNWWDPYGYGPAEPYDFHSHGSHTMGTMLGDDGAGNQIGMAPGATWFACQGFDQVTGSGYTAELLECAEFILAPWDLNMENPDPDMRPHVVNNSWGGGPNDGWYFNTIAAWRAAGIFPAFSAGNAGPECSTVNSPSDYYNAFASGAVNSADLIATFSSRGPSALGVMKPQVTAPGVSVRSAYNTGGYGLMSGTSMASPHSAGEVALIWSAQPDLIGNVQVTEWLMQQTADPILDDQCGDPGPPNYVYGWGRINAYGAVSTALTTEWDVGWLSVSPDMGAVAPGEQAHVAVTLDATGLLEGCLTAMLKIETNDPYLGLDTFVPVQMCVGELMIYLPILLK